MDKENNLTGNGDEGDIVKGAIELMSLEEKSIDDKSVSSTKEIVQLSETKDRNETKSELFGGQALVKKYQKWLRYEIVGLCILIAVVWGLLTLPIIFFYLPISVENKTNMDQLSMAQNDTMEPFACREDFFRDPNFNICLPLCPDWKQDPEAVSITIDVVVILSYTSGFIIAIVILVITAIRRDTMCSFPNSLVVYISIVYVVQNFFYIVTFFDRGGLYCSSKSLFETANDVTAFCVISGMVSVYSTLSVAIWWFFLTATLFWKIWFPFHARRIETAHKLHYIHITCVIIGVLVPFIPIISLMSAFSVMLDSQDPPKPTFWKGGLGFASARFPPLPCNGNDKNVLFYSDILPSDIILASGITLIILIFWLVHKQHGLFKANQYKNPFKIGSSERKLLLIFCYYIVATVINLTAFSDFARKADVFAAELEHYFRCEARGHDPENPCEFKRVISETLVVLSYSLHGILPVVNLIFAINIQDLKSKVGSIFSKVHSSTIKQ